jgi:hypothetical protein
MVACSTAAVCFAAYESLYQPGFRPDGSRYLIKTSNCGIGEEPGPS